MLKPSYRKRFQKDLKRVQKRGKDKAKLKFVMSELIHEHKLAAKYQDHSLKGEYSDCRECHIEPDWLLVYMILDNEIVFVRTGSHSDLFK